MKYNPLNTPAHLDIERDIQSQRDGLFTVILRVNQGRIVDYVRYKNSTQDDIKVLLADSFTEFILTPPNWTPLWGNAVWTDNLYFSD